jgi:2-phosphosulfolactate phosphatase
VGESLFAQPGTGVRFDWGPTGAAELARVCAALVLVDVLSFSTAVEIAVARGIRVHPFPWGGQAREYGERVGAAVAVGAARCRRGSPTRCRRRRWPALRPSPIWFFRRPTDPRSRPRPQRLACPSWRLPAQRAGRRALAGVRLVRDAAGTGRCGRRGRALAGRHLRPCVEDLLGAAAVIDALAGADALLSVEAAVALAAFAGVPDVAAAVRGCVSGQELHVMGFAADVELAVERDCSTVVPQLRGGAFVPALPH